MIDMRNLCWKPRLSFAFAIVLCIGNLSTVAAEPLKYLGIGNSFTWNSTTFLEEMAKSEGRDLEYFVAGIGSSSLEEHVRRIRIFESDPSNPEGKPYERTYNSEPGSFSLKAILQQEEWDVVSIQQLSWKSFDYSTYEPFAGELINYIKQYAPQAEIVIHMTWAYRKDHEWFVQGTRTQEEMFEGLKEAYKTLAENYGLRIVPIGAAIQEARQLPDWQFSFPDPKFNYENPKYPKLPKQKGSLINGWVWKENHETGEEEFRFDPTHANKAGCYLGGLVHMEFLFGEPVSKSVFKPEGINKKEARSLRVAAHSAIEEYREFNDSRLAPGD